MVLAAVLSMLRYVGEIDDRDFVDRLHSYFTTNILIGLSVLVSFKVCVLSFTSSAIWREARGVSGARHLQQLLGAGAASSFFLWCSCCLSRHSESWDPLLACL